VYGVGESCVQGFGRETSGKNNTGGPRLRWEDNIKTDLQEVGCGVWTGLNWLRIGQMAGICECGNETSGTIKRGEFLD
jgi:hypothetical protein